MPEIPVVAAVSAAPSSPAPSAPSTPVSAPSAAPSAAQPSSTPAPEAQQPVAGAAPEAQPGSESAAAAPAEEGWKGKPRPQSHDYNGDIAKFMTDELAWEDANPDGTTQPETKETADEQQVPEQQQDEQDRAADIDVTPQSVAGWLEDPDLKAWSDKNPEKKGALFAQLRELERARPIADLFPTVEDATFANETANRTVSIKSAFEGAVANPQNIESAVGMLLDEFLITDDKGQPVLDEDGHKQYAEDAQLMADYFADAKYEAKVGELKQAMASGKLNEHQQRNYQTAIDAWEFLKRFNATSDFERGLPDESEMDETTRNWVTQERDRIKTEQDKLEGNKRAAQTAQEKQAAVAHEKTVKVEAAKGFGSDIRKMVDEAITGGVYIPAFLLQEVDPTTGVNTFVKGIYDRFMMDTVGWSDSQKRYVPGKGVPRLKEKMAKLESGPRTEANQRARIDFFAQLRTDFLPKIFKSRLQEIQKYSRDERTRAAQKNGEARAKVTPEITSGSPSRPTAMTEKQAMTQAYADVDKKYEGKYLDASERTAKAIERFEQLTGGR